MVFFTKLFLFIFQFFLFNSIFTNFAMEEEDSITPELPIEIIKIIIDEAKYPDFEGEQNTITLYKDNYAVAIESNSSHYVTTDFSESHGEIYSPSKNLNSLDIISGRWLLFTQQAWLGWRDSNDYYRIDDDRTRKRYLRNDKGKIDQHLFDGINDHGIFLIIAHCATPQPSSHAYNFYLGKMTDDHKECYSMTHSHRPFSDDGKTFDYESQKNLGRISAFALCKTANRCILIDEQKKVTVFDITDNAQKTALQVSGLKGIAPTAIKKISFITPTTLLALSEKGKLFIVAADKGKPLQFFKQRFKKEDNSSILFSHCAVDPCNPSQIMLLSQDNKCIYWNLLYKQLSLVPLVHDFEKLEAHSLWFYNSSLGVLIKPQSQHHHNADDLIPTDDNFYKYNFKFYPAFNRFFKKYKNKASKTTVTSFNKKTISSLSQQHLNVHVTPEEFQSSDQRQVKNKYSFIKPLIITTAIVTGVASLYLYAKHKDSFSFDFEKLPSFFNKINNTNIFKFLYTRSI